MKLYALDGKVFETIKVGALTRDCINADGTCCDCRKPTGEDHDGGCDWEPCPRCGGQFIACNCDPDLRPGYSEEEAREVIANLQAALSAGGE